MWAPIIFVASLLSAAQATPVSLDARGLSLDARELSLDARGLSLDTRGLLQERQGSCLSVTRPANNPSVTNIGQVEVTSLVGVAATTRIALNNLITVNVLGRQGSNDLTFRVTNTGSANRLIITRWQ
jgi:hypothetical protein